MGRKVGWLGGFNNCHRPGTSCGGHAKNSDKLELGLPASLLIKRKPTIAFLFLYVYATWPQRPLALALGILISLYVYRFNLL
jgi:hypothetical protein